MAAYNKVPHEIHNNIVKYLGENELAKYRSVCKNWWFAATKKLFQIVQIYEFYHAVSLANSLLLNPLLGTFIHTLDLEYFDSIEYAEYTDNYQAQSSQDVFIIFVHYTPNIKYLRLSDVLYGKFYQAINASCCSEHWSNLESISPSSDFAIEAYYKMLLAFRHSLTKLNLKILTGLDNSTFDQFLSRKEEFVKVFEITIKIDELLLIVSDIDILFDGFPSLKSLNLSVERTMFMPELSELEPNSMVERLTLDVPNLTEQILEYTSQKFPSLSYLKLIHKRNNDCPSEACLRNFTRFLEGIDCIDIDINFQSDSDKSQVWTRDVLGHRLEMIHSSKRIYGCYHIRLLHVDQTANFFAAINAFVLFAEIQKAAILFFMLFYFKYTTHFNYLAYNRMSFLMYDWEETEDEMSRSFTTNPII
ncbi:hypothetical protein EDC96DRAFT_567787 [Choanephora cucurbitarum]|nr:hypothetical protein EDC96DRAFT_567787 [Choanephora cucurbitarum]